MSKAETVQIAADGVQVEEGWAPPPASPPDPGLAPEIERCLARRSDVWIFGYGSLMWNPGFPHCETRSALLRGYHRSFCVYSTSYRGTPERPGLVLGLDRGGSCRGLAFRVARGDIEAALHYLWEREMSGGTYDWRELPIETGEGALAARSFVVNRQGRGYAGRLSVAETARLILQGIGGRGPCREYLVNTVRHLEQLGLVDGPLHRLELAVKELAAREPPCADAMI